MIWGNQRAKVCFAAAWLILSAGILFMVAGRFPLPRPPVVYVVSGFVITLLFLQIFGRVEEMQTSEEVLVVFTTICVGVFLRSTQYARVLLSGSDHLSHYTVRAEHIVETGRVGSDFGLYSDSPSLHILIASYQQLSGLSTLDSRLLGLVLVSVVPVLFLSLGKLMDSKQSGYYALLLATPFPLFHRTMATYMTESLAIPTFVLLVILLLLSMRGDVRALVLLIGIAVSTTGIHYLYPIVILATLIGTTILLYISRSQLPPLKRTKYTVPVIGLLAAFGFHFFRLLSTENGGEMFVGIGLIPLLSGGPGGISSIAPKLSLQSILSKINPSSGHGHVSEAAGSQEGIGLVLNYAPVVLFLLIAAAGGVIILYDCWDSQYQFVSLIVAVVVAAGTILGVLFFNSSRTMRIGFRLYYFVAIIGLVFAAVAFRRIELFFEQTPSLSLQTIALVALVILSAGMATLGPMSSLGNNVDSPFGGNRFLTYSDYQQLSMLDQKTAGDEQIRDSRSFRLSLPPEPWENPLAPTGRLEQQHLFIIDETESCGDSSAIWDSNNISLCRQPSRR